jgi:hypothetical protein
MGIEKLFFKIVKLRDQGHLFFTFTSMRRQVFQRREPWRTHLIGLSDAMPVAVGTAAGQCLDY